MKAGRSDCVDLARGLALVAMAVYHSIWDFSDAGFLSPATPFTTPMRFASHAIAAVFLALVGLSLALAHRQGPRWRAFFMRVAIVAIAAGVVSIGTYFAEPQAPVGFGILHCIAAASLLSAPLLLLPGWVGVLVGLAAIVAPSIFTSSLFDPTWLVWTGLATREPFTVDWRPLLPFGGIVWLSLGLARSLPASVYDAKLFLWRASPAVLRGLTFLGRHSLAFYLIHQPILFAFIFGASNMLGVAETRDRQAIEAQCRPACVEGGGQPDACARACACVAERAVRAKMFASTNEKATKDLAAACVVDTR